MLAEASCSKRSCVHYLGIKKDEKREMGVWHSCSAFPDGIPYGIAYGGDRHKRKVKGQVGDFVFQAAPKQLTAALATENDTANGGVHGRRGEELSTLR
jgi:hypothetical protein